MKEEGCTKGFVRKGRFKKVGSKGWGKGRARTLKVEKGQEEGDLLSAGRRGVGSGKKAAVPCGSVRMFGETICRFSTPLILNFSRFLTSELCPPLPIHRNTFHALRTLMAVPL